MKTFSERLADLEQMAAERRQFVAEMRADFARMSVELDKLEERARAVRASLATEPWDWAKVGDGKTRMDGGR